MGGGRGQLTTPSNRDRALRSLREAVKSGARQTHACVELGLSVRTAQRWKKQMDVCVDRRTTVVKKAVNKLSETVRAEILEIANSPDFSALPPAQIVPKLADQARYVASESSFYRALKEAKQMTHRQASAPKKHQRPKPAIASKPNQVYSWDITYLPLNIKGSFCYLYLFLDIYSRKIVGWQVHESESAEFAADLLKDIVRREEVKSGEVLLHSDNGSPMKGATMLATLQSLGVMPSFSRPGVSDDNAFIESFFKTLKYAPVYPKSFEDVAAARVFVEEFAQWYNHEHQHSGLRYVTPAQRHAGEDGAILAKRKVVYERAKQTYPQRWNGRKTRNWDPVSEVFLNPERGKTIELKQAA